MAVLILADTVVKQQPPERARRELAKAIAGYELSRSSALFRAPRIVSADEQSGTIVFERLTNVSSLRHALVAMNEDARLATMSKVANVLRTIHECLPLAPPWSADRADGGIEAPVLEARLHGDFTLDNLLYDQSTGELAIVDWSMPAWLDWDACCGPAAVDLVGMAISLFNQRIVQRRQLRNPERLTIAFLEAYQRGLASSQPLRLLRVFTVNFAKCVDAQRHTAGWQFALYRSHHRRLVALMQSLPSTERASDSTLHLQTELP